MDESALERFFDKYIANEYKEEEEEDKDNKEFFDLLPDELLLYYKPSPPPQDDTENQRKTPDMPEAGCSSSLDYISKNPTDKTSCPNLHAPTTRVTPERGALTPKIRNIVSAVNLCCNLDLSSIARNMWNVVYDTKNFPGLILRFRKPRSTVTVFSSGKAVCTGTKSTEESKLATRRCARKIQKLGFPVSFRNFKIQNIMASARTLPLRLNQLMLAHKEHCSYEPEQFPGLFYRGIPGICVAITHKGGITLTGAKNLDDIDKAVDTLSNIFGEQTFKR